MFEHAPFGPDSPADATQSICARAGLWSGLVAAVICAALATSSRLAELSLWRSDPAQYVASGVPMMTTLDAYYSLRLARLHAAGQFVAHGPVPARHYSRPEQSDPNVLYEQREPQALPLLSGLVGDLSRLSGVGVDWVGLVLPPLLSSLFIIPLFLCCWRLGVPAAGLMGGLIATFSIDYYRRTSVGWVDTDALNLFFPWTATCLILAIRGGERRQTLLLLSAATGIVMYVFFRWYGKPGLTLAYGGAFAIHLLVAKVPWRRTMLCVATFVVFANVLQFASALANLTDFASRYLWPSAVPAHDLWSGIRFAPVWTTIGEAQHLPAREVLARVAGRADLGLIGLIGFVFFAISRWRSMAALMPVTLLAMLAWVSEHFIFYLAPLVGIGWGFIVALVVARTLGGFAITADAFAQTRGRRWRLAALRGVRAASQRGESRAALAYAAVLAIFAIVFVPLSGSRAFVPRPALPAPVFRDLQTLATRLPATSRLWTWWDFGFAIVDTTGFGVYHDGAAQYTPQTNLVAASFVVSDPRALYDIIRFVDRDGNRGIRRLAAAAYDFDDLVARMREPDRATGDAPIYVLFTPDMMLKYAAMRALGSSSPANGPRRDLPGIQPVTCEEAIDDTLRCGRRIIDLRTGSIEPRVAARDSDARVRLRRSVVVENGRVLHEREYDAGADPTVEIVVRNSAVIAVYLLDETAFASNLNQMFMLGRFDASRFEESFNDFPYARAFRVLKSPQ